MPRPCDACRASVDDCATTLALARTDGAPEPSPLFWDHLSARVGAAVRDEADSRARRAVVGLALGPGIRAGAAVLVAALVVMPRDAARVGPGHAGEQPAAAAAGCGGDRARGRRRRPTMRSWMLMRDLSQDMSADEARAALPARPGRRTGRSGI